MKQDTKHTQGKLHQNEHLVFSDNRTMAICECIVENKTDPTGIIAKANAARIVTAWNEYDTLKEAMRLLESLTPGGNEFVNDPRACADHVKEDLHWLRDTSKKLTLSHKMLSDENNQLKALCSKMLGELKRIRDNYDNVEDLAGVIARGMYDIANNILNPSKTEDK